MPTSSNFAKGIWYRHTLLILAFLASLPLQSDAREKPSDQPGDLAVERVLFLGDSITDGNTYPLLFRQALEDAGQPVPICINAGIGGDTAAGMLKRLDRDVFPRRPTLVMLSAGINDVLHKVPDAEYERDISLIADRMAAMKIPLVILTTSILGPTHAEADEHLTAYNRILRDIAQKHECRLADVNHLMHNARGAHTLLLEDDNVHPNFEGHRLMARAILDGLGHPDIAVPAKLKLQLMPGVIRNWKIRSMPADAKPLDELTAATLKPDESWTSYRLPETEPLDNWWKDQERQRGFAVSLQSNVGKARTYQAYATVQCDKARIVCLNPAAEVTAVWFNGKRLYQAGPIYTGWHAGHERIDATLLAGENKVVIETGPAFFLSLTEKTDE